MSGSTIATPGLLLRVETFMREAEMPPSVFGRDAMRDPGFVGGLRNGRKAGIRAIRRADAFMEKWREDYDAGRVSPVGDRRFRTGFEDTPLADRAMRQARNDRSHALALLLAAAERIKSEMGQ